MLDDLCEALRLKKSLHFQVAAKQLHKAEAEDRMVVSDQNRTVKVPLGLSSHGCRSFLRRSRVGVINNGRCCARPRPRAGHRGAIIALAPSAIQYRLSSHMASAIRTMLRQYPAPCLS